MISLLNICVLYFYINPSLSQGCKPNPPVLVEVSFFLIPTGHPPGASPLHKRLQHSLQESAELQHTLHTHQRMAKKNKSSRCPLCSWEMAQEGSESTWSLPVSHLSGLHHGCGTWAGTAGAQVGVFGKEMLLVKGRDCLRFCSKSEGAPGTPFLLPPPGVQLLLWFQLRSSLWKSHGQFGCAVCPCAKKD